MGIVMRLRSTMINIPLFAGVIAMATRKSVAGTLGGVLAFSGLGALTAIKYDNEYDYDYEYVDYPADETAALESHTEDPSEMFDHVFDYMYDYDYVDYPADETAALESHPEDPSEMFDHVFVHLETNTPKDGFLTDKCFFDSPQSDCYEEYEGRSQRCGFRGAQSAKLRDYLWDVYWRR